MRHLLLLLFVIALPFAARSQGQVDGKPTVAESAAPTAPKIDTKALGIFERAVKAQCPDGRPDEITSFEGHFKVTFRDFSKDPKKPEIKQGTIAQFWAKRPHPYPLKENTPPQTIYRRDLVTNVAEPGLTLGSDWGDQVAWRWKTSGKGKVTEKRPLNTSEYKQEKQEIKREKRRVGDLFQVLVLTHLNIDRTSLRLVAEDVAIQIKVNRRPFPHQADLIAFKDLAGNEFQIWVQRDRKNRKGKVIPGGHVVRAKVRLKGRTWEQFDMTQHHEAVIGDKRLMVPCNIVYYDGARPVLSAATNRPTKEAFRFNHMDKKTIEKVFPFKQGREF